MNTVRETGELRPATIGDAPEITRVQALRQLLEPHVADSTTARIAGRLRSLVALRRLMLSPIRQRG